MSKHPADDGGPAFPEAERCSGMSLRQYAAIKLCVPDSGTDWLDEMIEEARRDAFAAAALTGLLADHTMEPEYKHFTKDSWELARMMLAERAKGGGE